MKEINMTKIYNKISEKEKRRQLRNNMSKAEVYLWVILKNKRMLNQRFLRQYSIGPYVLDFYCPELRLAIEVDGATHITDEELEYDKNRQSEIENMYINFIRFTNEEIYKDMNGVKEKIEMKIDELMK
jgi:very-short-patch-repair endonuclease